MIYPCQNPHYAEQAFPEKEDSSWKVIMQFQENVTHSKTTSILLGIKDYL